MNVAIILNPIDRRDIALRDEVVGWLHYAQLRSAWTMTESEIEREADDDEERVTLTVSFSDPFDAHDFYYSRGLHGRGRIT